ncbi:MAG TPA: GFA family protein [Polyangiaceae bacterium]|nr:GFA family protein [Polyangiaceae bacterium]
MSMETEYKGRCFCGKVEISVAGEPAAMGYCHCASCREWSAGPVNAFTLWQPTAITVTKGAELVGAYSKTPKSIRKWCTACGGHLLTEHPIWGLTDVYAAVIPDFPFSPMLHVNYEDTVLNLHDGLPKQMDVPSEMGGSGTLAAE